MFRKENLIFSAFLIICSFLITTSVVVIIMQLTGWGWYGYIEGESMYPTIKDGDLLFAIKTNNIQREDIVVIDDTNNFLTENGARYACPYFIKRVVAIPGDTIESIDGIVKINGKIYIGNTENFSNSLKQTFTITLGENEYFVIGDNFARSNDSRAWEEKIVPGENIYVELFHCHLN